MRLTSTLLASTSTILVLLAMGCSPSPGAQADTVIFLVRHAERADDAPAAADPQMMSEDPPLSQAGTDRAELLAAMLRDVEFSHVHSTDYRRTRETARPTAERAGIEISIYDAAELEAFAHRLLAAPGTHLVVGHSNTTPALVEALGGRPGPAIQSLEYDRLYMVFSRGGVTRTILLRFGDAFDAGNASGT